MCNPGSWSLDPDCLLWDILQATKHDSSKILTEEILKNVKVSNSNIIYRSVFFLVSFYDHKKTNTGYFCNNPNFPQKIFPRILCLSTCYRVRYSVQPKCQIPSECARILLILPDFFRFLVRRDFLRSQHEVSRRAEQISCMLPN